MVTVLTDAGEWIVNDADPSPEALWLPASEVESATGWVAKPEGLCNGPVCVPLAASRRQELIHGTRVNLGALWRHLGCPVVCSERGHVWVLAKSARERGATLRSLEAPDFALPDVSGRLHSLSEYRGKKILLVTWASW